MYNRLVIYFHYDPRGQADAACRFAVQAMREQARVLLFVTNGSLHPDTRRWLQVEQIRFLERENRGLDIGAYREALISFGRAALDSFDEIVLMNYTLAGPVCPLEPMFVAMEARTNLDFWGLSRHYSMRSRRFGKNGFVPEHIQSHFIAVRRRMYDDFWQYWQAMHLPDGYEDSVRCHEILFTSHFARLGYRWDTFLDGDAWRGLFVNPLMACPVELIKDHGCPFFKRRSFFTPYDDELRRTDGCAAARLYTYLKNETHYPVDGLLAGLLPIQPLAELSHNLHWYYTIPERCSGPVPVKLTPQELQNGVQLDRGTLYWIPCRFFSGGTLAWYEQTYRWDDRTLAAVHSVFESHPLLGVAGPALPLGPDAVQAKEARWRRDLAQIKQTMNSLGLSVPVTEEPLPVPNGCGLLVRAEAFPDGLPPVRTTADLWLLPLIAQQNGYYSAVVAAQEQAAALTDIYLATVRPMRTVSGTAGLLARKIKHALLRRKEGDE